MIFIDTKIKMHAEIKFTRYISINASVDCWFKIKSISRSSDIQVPQKPEVDDAKAKAQMTSQRVVSQLGFSLSQMMSVFRQEAPSSALDPDSMEAIAECKYIRTANDTPPA